MIGPGFINFTYSLLEPHLRPFIEDSRKEVRYGFPTRTLKKKKNTKNA